MSRGLSICKKIEIRENLDGSFSVPSARVEEIAYTFTASRTRGKTPLERTEPYIVTPSSSARISTSKIQSFEKQREQLQERFLQCSNFQTSQQGFPFPLFVKIAKHLRCKNLARSSRNFPSVPSLRAC